MIFLQPAPLNGFSRSCAHYKCSDIIIIKVHPETGLSLAQENVERGQTVGNGHPETGLSAEQEIVERGQIVRKVHPETGLSTEQENVERGEIVRNVHP